MLIVRRFFPSGVKQFLGAASFLAVDFLEFMVLVFICGSWNLGAQCFEDGANHCGQTSQLSLFEWGVTFR